MERARPGDSDGRVRRIRPIRVTGGRADTHARTTEGPGGGRRAGGRADGRTEAQAPTVRHRVVLAGGSWAGGRGWGGAAGEEGRDGEGRRGGGRDGRRERGGETSGREDQTLANGLAARAGADLPSASKERKTSSVITSPSSPAPAHRAAQQQQRTQRRRSDNRGPSPSPSPPLTSRLLP
jgi:hypothetical protein